MPTGNKPLRDNSPHRLAVAVYNGLCTFEFGTAVEVFGRPGLDFAPWYSFDVVPIERSIRHSIGGLSIAPAYEGMGRFQNADTIIIPGWRDANERPPEQFLKVLRSAHTRAARIVSFSSGIFALAEAGILNGKRAVTHWRYEDLIKERYPEIILEPDLLYTEDSNLYTSAGIGAGIDLSLYLVSKDFGISIANRMARRFLSSPHRAGTHAQIIDSPMREQPQEWVSDLSSWVITHLRKPISIDHLAEMVHMSRRTFIRHFTETVGIAPGRWLVGQRIAYAKNLLATTNLSIEQIAENSGFNSASAMRHHFRRIDSKSPRIYRRNVD